MFCPKCSAENPENAQYCRKCGRRIPKLSDSDNKAKSKESDTDSAWGSVGVIIVAFFFIVVLIAEF